MAPSPSLFISQLSFCFYLNFLQNARGAIDTEYIYIYVFVFSFEFLMKCTLPTTPSTPVTPRLPGRLRGPWPMAG